MFFPLQTPAVEAVDVQLSIAEFPAGLLGVLAVEHAAVA